MPAAGLSGLLFLVLLGVLQFGPALGLAGWRLTQHTGWAFIGLSRDVLAALLMAAALPTLLVARRVPLPPSARWALLLAGAYALLALLSPAPLAALALNLRRLLLIPLLYVAVLVLPWAPQHVHAALRALLGTCIAVALFGMLERLAPELLWTDWLDIVGYTSANPLDPFGAVPFHESGRFFSWDAEAWAGTPLRRAVATYLEPTTLAAALAAGLVMALAQRARLGPRVGWGGPLLLLACGLLTLAKSFWLFLPLLLLSRTLGWPTPRHVLPLTLGACLLALAAGSGGALRGPLEHIAGLASSLQHLGSGEWLGEGIGMAGNYADSDADIGSESGLGNVIAQVGVAALLPLLWVRAVATDVLAAAQRRRDPGGRWLAGWLLFWLLSFLFSASSLGVGGNAIGFMMLALYLHPAAAAVRER
jgi:hypothetical protein